MKSELFTEFFPGTRVPEEGEVLALLCDDNYRIIRELYKASDTHGSAANEHIGDILDASKEVGLDIKAAIEANQGESIRMVTAYGLRPALGRLVSLAKAHSVDLKAIFEAKNYSAVFAPIHNGNIDLARLVVDEAIQCGIDVKTVLEANNFLAIHGALEHGDDEHVRYVIRVAKEAGVDIKAMLEVGDYEAFRRCFSGKDVTKADYLLGLAEQHGVDVKSALEAKDFLVLVQAATYPWSRDFLAYSIGSAEQHGVDIKSALEARNYLAIYNAFATGNLDAMKAVADYAPKYGVDLATALSSNMGAMGQMLSAHPRDLDELVPFAKRCGANIHAAMLAPAFASDGKLLNIIEWELSKNRDVLFIGEGLRAIVAIAFAEGITPEEILAIARNHPEGDHAAAAQASLRNPRPSPRADGVEGAGASPSGTSMIY